MPTLLRWPNLRHQSPLFELPLTMKVQKVGFQDREDETLLEKGGSANVHDYVHANRTFQVRFIFDADFATLA